MVFPAAADRTVIAPAAPALSEALVLHGVTHSFGNTKALQGATLHVRTGTVHALLGENGAGKTTLMHVAFGLVQPDAGTITVHGVARRFRSPGAALSAGVGMVHQHFTLVPAMTVAENVALGSSGRFSAHAWSNRVRDIGNRTGLILDANARVADLSVSAQQRCEIVKALARDVRILILDEPTAVLAPAEAQQLLKWIRAFADEGNAVVLITHKLRDALAVADDITVLRRGITVLSAPIASVTESQLAQAMLGNEHHALVVAESQIAQSVTREAAITLQATDLSFQDASGVVKVQHASLSVHAGEIVGLAAIEGAGQHELLRMLAGRLRPTSGTLKIPSAIGFVPEDRHGDALMLSESLIDNVALRNAAARKGRMPWKALRESTRRIVSEYQVRSEGLEVEARTLSGGNQQKLIVGRELAGAPTALVVENATRGLDFRAAGAVHEALRAARNRGTAIMLYSSDLDEVLAMADRVLVMHAGQLVEVGRDRERVGRAMLGS